MAKAKKNDPVDNAVDVKPAVKADPVALVARVVGCGLAAAARIVDRMGPAADELPAKYASGQARDWITEHNVSKPAETSPPVVDDDPMGGQTEVESG